MPGVVWQEVAPIRALLPISLSEPPPDVNQLFWHGDATLPAPNGEEARGRRNCDDRRDCNEGDHAQVFDRTGHRVVPKFKKQTLSCQWRTLTNPLGWRAVPEGPAIRRGPLISERPIVKLDSFPIVNRQT